MTRIAVAIATVGGAGYAPIAPGTVGSAVGVVIYLLTMHWPAIAQVGLLAAISAVGIAASTRAAAVLGGGKDPGAVVVDEVAGQLMTLLLTGVLWPGAIAGFLIFRVLDVVKPWPAQRFEALPGGLGIMADDLMAGVYGNLIMLSLMALLSWMV